MTRITFIELGPASSEHDPFSASCRLQPGEIRERLADWRALRERCIRVEVTPTGAVLELAGDEALDRLAALIHLESQCCGFYRFSLHVRGSSRQLEIDAGPNGHLAATALLALDP